MKEPQSSFIGNRPIQNLFATLWRTQTLAHALMLTGPEHVGKTTFAKALAQRLLCQDSRQQLWGCGECFSCQQFSHGSHPDAALLDQAPGERITIDAVRELLHRLGQTGMISRERVAIIAQAGWMTSEAATALLKFLEEPRPGATIILTTTTVDGMLPTIISRCQVYRFQRATKEELAPLVAPADSPQRSELLLASRGCPGTLIELLGNTERSNALQQSYQQACGLFDRADDRRHRAWALFLDTIAVQDDGGQTILEDTTHAARDLFSAAMTGSYEMIPERGRPLIDPQWKRSTMILTLTTLLRLLRLHRTGVKPSSLFLFLPQPLCA